MAQSLIGGVESDSAYVLLPSPQKSGGMPLFDALRLRHSTRDYARRPLDLQTLSNLLWSAFGTNRPNDDRTAPYWRHVMAMDIYVATADGVWMYDAKDHALGRHIRDDIRAATGLQDFVADAPVNLIYVADGKRMPDVSPDDRRLYASVDAGFVGENVYLFCTAAGLGTVFRGAIDYAGLAHALKLPDQQFVVFAQTVGYAAG
jgi:nitroreductase